MEAKLTIFDLLGYLFSGLLVVCQVALPFLFVDTENFGTYPALDAIKSIGAGALVFLVPVGFAVGITTSCFYGFVHDRYKSSFEDEAEIARQIIGMEVNQVDPNDRKRLVEFLMLTGDFGPYFYRLAGHVRFGLSCFVGGAIGMVPAIALLWSGNIEFWQYLIVCSLLVIPGIVGLQHAFSHAKAYRSYQIFALNKINSSTKSAG